MNLFFFFQEKYLTANYHELFAIWEVYLISLIKTASLGSSKTSLEKALRHTLRGTIVQWQRNGLDDLISIFRLYHL